METISIILIIIGIALLVAEIFIPSFGVTGTVGLIGIIAGIILSAESLEQGIIMFLVILAIVLVLMFIAYRFVASKRSPLVLKENLKEEQGSDLEYFMDKQGVALTTLRPSGKGSFDGVKLDVLTTGEYIKKSEHIKITSIQGKKIFVSRID